MKAGDLVRDMRCGTLCVVKGLHNWGGDRYAMVLSFSGNEEVEIKVSNLEIVNESR